MGFRREPWTGAARPSLRFNSTRRSCSHASTTLPSLTGHGRRPWYTSCTLTGATAEAHKAGADLAEGLYQIWDTRKWFVSSEGHRIDQHIRECGAGLSVTVIGEGETQRRSYPAYRGQYGTQGWELVDRLDIGAHAIRIAEEAQALLKAPACPAEETALILG